MITGLSKVSRVYKWIGAIFIALGLFLLFESIVALFHVEKISGEPILGAYFLSGGLFTLFAGYIGQAIDYISNSQRK